MERALPDTQAGVTRPRIVVVATGGTIAQTDSKEAELLIDELVNAVPQLEHVAQVSAEQLLQVSSPDITTDDWLVLAKWVNSLVARDDVQGVVVTHGTDTLEETAYFLNLVVKSSKPVVMMGSMRGSRSLCTDGPANLLSAVIVASDPRSTGRGVLVSLNDRIFAARDVTKLSTFALDAFGSPESGPIGSVRGGRPTYYRRVERRHTTDSEFDVSHLASLPEVAIVYGFVGIGPSALRQVAVDSVRGIVFAGTGNGSLPKVLQATAAELTRSGIAFVRGTRVSGGGVERNGEHSDDCLGTISADSLSPQKARVLLMLALSNSRDAAEIQRNFDTY